MITLLLDILHIAPWLAGGVGLDRAGAFVSHHRGGLSTAVLTIAAWIGHRAKRRFKSTGKRVAPKTPKTRKAATA